MVESGAVTNVVTLEMRVVDLVHPSDAHQETCGRRH
jgi:hypothetical protein